jgi:hypothetical protein
MLAVPYVIVCEAVRLLNVGVALFTVCATLPLLPLLFESPVYSAVMMCDPAVGADVVKVACPEAFRAVGPDRTVVSSLKVTVPVGVPPPLETVAVKVTDCPKVDGFCEELTAVVVSALLTVCVTLPLLALKLPPPR